MKISRRDESLVHEVCLSVWKTTNFRFGAPPLLYRIPRCVRSPFSETVLASLNSPTLTLRGNMDGCTFSTPRVAIPQSRVCESDIFPCEVPCCFDMRINRLRRRSFFGWRAVKSSLLFRWWGTTWQTLHWIFLAFVGRHGRITERSNMTLKRFYVQQLALPPDGFRRTLHLLILSFPRLSSSTAVGSSTAAGPWPATGSWPGSSSGSLAEIYPSTTLLVLLLNGNRLLPSSNQKGNRYFGEKRKKRVGLVGLVWHSDPRQKKKLSPYIYLYK